MPVQTYLAQGQLAPDLSPLSRDILDVLDRNGRSAAKLGAILQAYVGLASALGSPDQAQMFARETPTVGELFSGAVDLAGGGDAQVQAQVLQDAAPGRAAPGRARPAAGPGGVSDVAPGPEPRFAARSGPGESAQPPVARPAPRRPATPAEAADRLADAARDLADTLHTESTPQGEQGLVPGTARQRERPVRPRAPRSRALGRAHDR
jgi:hypothetical protein